jgi:hypothetical protein
VVSALRREEGWPVKYSSILSEARLMLASFLEWMVLFVHKKGNTAAHTLTRFAVHHNIHHI